MRCPSWKRDDLTEADFGKGGTKANGLQVYCRICDKLKQKASREAHLEATKVSVQ